MHQITLLHGSNKLAMVEIESRLPAIRYLIRFQMTLTIKPPHPLIFAGMIAFAVSVVFVVLACCPRCPRCSIVPVAPDVPDASDVSAVNFQLVNVLQIKIL